MKNYFILLVMMCFSFTSYTQDAKFSVKVSKTNMNTNTKFKVEFVLENANGSQFQAPNFDDFIVVGGPSTSSQMSIINGEVTQSMTYSYYLKPKKTGSLVVPAASIKVKGETLKTEKVKIKVSESDENDEEEAAIEENERIKTPQSASPFGDDFFGQFFGRQAPVQPKKEEPKKKERKSYNL